MPPGGTRSRHHHHEDERANRKERYDGASEAEGSRTVEGKVQLDAADEGDRTVGQLPEGPGLGQLVECEDSSSDRQEEPGPPPDWRERFGFGPLRTLSDATALRSCRRCKGLRRAGP